MSLATLTPNSRRWVSGLWLANEAGGRRLSRWCPCTGEVVSVPLRAGTRLNCASPNCLQLTVVPRLKSKCEIYLTSVNPTFGTSIGGAAVTTQSSGPRAWKCVSFAQVSKTDSIARASTTGLLLKSLCHSD